MTLRETLPDGCPPDEAEEIVIPRIVYRLVRNDPPREEDFRSQRAEHPDRVFRNVNECRARGLSVRADRRESIEYMKLRSFCSSLLCRVQLGGGAGYIQQTGEGTHHTWWPLADYDILANSSLEAL